MQQNRQQPVEQDYQQQVMEVLAWLYDAFPDDHPFAGNPVIPSNPAPPQTWLLGSSPNSSSLAGALGIGYTFAAFINPRAAALALGNYRETFRPSGFGIDAPHGILAVNVAVGEDHDAGVHLANSPKGYYARLNRAGRQAGQVMVPTADQAAAELTDAEKDEPVAIVDGVWPRFVAGSPGEVRATLEQMAAQAGVEEIMIQDLIGDPGARRRSHELLATAFGLPGPVE